MHDAAHSGLVFHPALPRIADRLGLVEGQDTSPPLMAPVIGGPILAALGALTGSRLLAKLGIFLGIGSAAAMADIGLRKTVPGANDNGTGVIALLALGRRGGVVQRGDQSVRGAPLPAAAARQDPLRLDRLDRLPSPARSARRRILENARVLAAGTGAVRRPRR